ncbi:MAG: hypothetical protein CR959_01165 [Fusobacteriales bacterium]|nr:MAG: hypothetical protein CR959_01165 [Fusobacteriales bacterium]
MKINSKAIVLNFLGEEANISINKKILLTLGIDEAFFLSYLINQYKYYEREGLLKEDGSFYASNMDIALYTTFSNSRITRVKKAGVEKNLFKIFQERKENTGLTVTYYKLNFDKILEIIGMDKSDLELAYENIYEGKVNEIEEIENLEDIEKIKRLSVRELRFLLKKNEVKYSGKDKKSDLINKFIEQKNPVLFNEIKKANNDFITVDENIIHQWTQKLSTAKKQELSAVGGHKNRPPVDTKSVTNQEQIKPRINTCHDHEFKKIENKIENLLHDYEINYTHTNRESIYEIFNSLNKNEKSLFEYLERILKEVKNTFGVQNKGGLFTSKIRKRNEDLIKKLNSKVEKAEKIHVEQENLKKSEEKIKNGVNRVFLILNKFNTLNGEEKKQVEEMAIKEFSKNPNTDLNDLMEMKRVSEPVYHKMLSQYLERAMLDLEKAV